MQKASINQLEVSSCYHCGQVLVTDILFDDKHFCCNGCKVVYEMLEANNLCDYYQLKEGHAGIAQSVNSDLSKFNYLDSGNVLETLADYKDEHLAKITFNIPQMHCSACIYLLENLHLLNNAVESCYVNFPNKKATILFKYKQLPISNLVGLLSNIGYEPSLSMENLNQQKNKKPKQNNTLIAELGVAGFCFGNIMLLSFPEYFTPEGMETGLIKNAISFLTVLMSLPIVFYAANGYYKSAWYSLKQKRLNIDMPIVLGIGALFIRSLYEVIAQTGPGYFDSLSGLLFFLLLGKYFQQKTFDHLSFERNYKSFFPISINKIVGRVTQQLPIDVIEKGDLVVIKNEELIPGDCLLNSQKALIDYSFVTGESAPVEKFKGDVIYAGGRLVGESIQVEILKKPSQSYLTQLWNHDSFQKTQHKDRYQSITDKVSTYFTPAVLVIATVGFIVWATFDLSIAFQVLAAVLIIACPCALALSAPFTFGNVIRLLGYKKCYLKNAGIVDKLSQIDTIIFDKTGTLTTRNNNQLDLENLKLSTDDFKLVKATCMQSNHPLSQQLSSMIFDDNLPSIDLYNEVKGKGIAANIKGKTIKVGSYAWVTGEEQASQVAATRVYVAINEKLCGYVSFTNQYRPKLAEIINELKKQYRLVVLSGDNSGETNFLQTIFGQNAELHFNQLPADKLSFLQKEAERGHKTMMVGDGLNDAGALQASWVGVALTENSNFFSPASDAILGAESFADLPKIMEFARKSRHIIWRNLSLSVIYNIVGLSFALSGQLTPVVSAILMPLSSITVIVAATAQTRYLAYKLKLSNIWK